jgi:hypothetical protein
VPPGEVNLPGFGEVEAVQLAWWDIDADVMTGHGASLQRITSELPVVTFRTGSLQETWTTLKQIGGWRVLTDLVHGPWRRLVLGAPHPAERGSWVVAMLQESDEGDMRVVRVFEQERMWPSRSDRRRSLGLEWTKAEFSAPPWNEPVLRVRLVNLADAEWIGRPGDTAEALARLHDPASRELLPSTRHLRYSPLSRAPKAYPSIPVGGSLELPVQLTTDGLSTLPSGTYPISAWLEPLILKSELFGQLRIGPV